MQGAHKASCSKLKACCSYWHGHFCKVVGVYVWHSRERWWANARGYERGLVGEHGRRPAVPALSSKKRAAGVAAV